MNLKLLSLLFPANPGLVYSHFLELHGNLENVKGKPTKKTCFSSEKKRLTERIYETKFCLAAFLGSQRNLFCASKRNREALLKDFIIKGLF